ncbi:MAG: hypothetical protein ACYC69_08980 [Thermodesulfovibrionales bacterium]
MKRIVTYYFLIIVVVNLLIYASVAWFNPLIRKVYAPLGSSMSLLSLWAFRMETFFLLIAAISLFCMVLSFMNRLADRFLMPVVFVVLLSDIACLMITTFGYTLPFVSYVPKIK